MSLAFMQEESAFVADRVFQDIPVQKQADAYFTYDRGEWNRDEMKERAPATESAGSTYTVGNTTYFARVRALHRDVPDQIRDNADSPIDLDAEAMRYVTGKALINREVNFVNGFLLTNNPGVVWTNVGDGNAARSAALDFTDNANNNLVFWNLAASTPIEDIRLAKRTVQEATGFRPNVLTLQRTVFDALVDHGDIVGRMDRGQTTGTAMVNKESLAALLELDEVLVMDSIQNTALQGATAVHSFIAGNQALLTYRPPAPGILTPAAGYTFSWSGYLGATNMGTRISTIPMDHLKAMRVEIESAYDQHLVAADLGFMFDGIVE
jgi:hypothetical protein